MQPTWTSNPIHLVEGLVIEVRASSDGVTIAKQVDGVYASDMLLTAAQASELADALRAAAAKYSKS